MHLHDRCGEERGVLNARFGFQPRTISPFTQFFDMNDELIFKAMMDARLDGKATTVGGNRASNGAPPSASSAPISPT
jgi:hypothetical protein